jgi:hypothetical protein
MLASGQRVLGSLPRRVRELSWTEVQTHKYEDFARDVVCFRDGPKYVRGCVEKAERIMEQIEAKVAKSMPTMTVPAPRGKPKLMTVGRLSQERLRILARMSRLLFDRTAALLVAPQEASPPCSAPT